MQLTNVNKWNLFVKLYHKRLKKKMHDTNMNTKSNFLKTRHMCFKLDVFF